VAYFAPIVLLACLGVQALNDKFLRSVGEQYSMAVVPFGLALCLAVAFLIWWPIRYEFDGTAIRKFTVLGRCAWEVPLATVQSVDLRYGRGNDWLSIRTTTGRKIVELFPGLKAALSQNST
jgi:hypothetical protein